MSMYCSGKGSQHSLEEVELKRGAKTMLGDHPLVQSRTGVIT